MGGSSGSAGKVDFPAYMKDMHGDWLDHGGTDTMTFSVVDLMNTAQTGNSPYSGYTPVDPDDAFFASGQTLANYLSSYEQLKLFDDWGMEAAYDGYIVDDAARITAAVAAQSALMNDEIDTTILPAFKAGLANMNATMSSAFVIGEAVIRDGKARKLAETDANIRLARLEQGAVHALNRANLYMEWKRLVTVLTTENARMYLQAYADRDEMYLHGLHKNATWDLEMYQYGYAGIASIHGSSGVIPESPRGGKLAGAMSGAAVGYQVGGGYGAAVGGVIGFIAS